MKNLFRILAYLEGTSFLVLLLIAMPLKYLYHMPLAVRIVGSAHGALFVAYCLVGAILAHQLKWSARTTALAFVSAFLPAGPFIFDRKILESTSD